MKKFYTPEKFMLLVSFIILTVASVLSFFLEPCKTTIIPFPQYTVPFINSFSALFCFFLFFKPSFYKGQCLILIIQSITTTLTGYEILGTFLYFAAILILFCEGYFKNNFKQKILFIIVCWFFVTLGVIPFGFHRFILELAVSLFFLGFYIFLYSKLKDLLKKRGKLTVTEVVDIMMQLTDGMSAAHDHYIIHRDIKPQNVLCFIDKSDKNPHNGFSKYNK